MRKYLFISCLVILSLSTKAQKLYVEKTDGGYEQPIVDKLISKNYRITFRRDSADYVIMCIIWKTGMGRANGSLGIVNNKTGDLVVKSKEVTGQTMAFNGYANPKMLAMKKLSDKYLIEMLSNLTKR